MWLIGSFATLCLVEFTLAIYVPSERTTKPPVRRESILPWYLTGEDSPPPEDPSRSPKWDLPEDRPREPAIVDAGVKTWPKRLESSYSQRSEPPFQDDFSQRKDLEQKTDHGGSWIPEEVPEENLCDPSNPTENCNVHKSRRRDKVLNVEIIPDLYENVPLDSTKPRKGKILTISKPDHKSIVAKYSSSGVQCPDESATGQFVYPPDCKFFVNCWAGRAFVQPCAPGTLFNPDTLECDFPYKVKCYGGELADFTAPDNLDATGRREPLVQGTHSKPGSANLLEPKCPPHVTGLLAHPADCTKFLQCANGGTFVMDCGPGTVFNPAISVCDWPNNVQGCEDALKTDEEVSLLTGHQDYGSKKDTGWSSGQNRIQKSEEKISCPAGHTGQLPHPRDCKKFLQCNRGGTFIMDCGPGTVFNPITTACDWPYKVKGCNGQQNKPISQGGNAGSQWPTTQNTGHRVQQSWQGNVQSQHNGPNWGQQNGQHVYAQYNPADPDPRGHGYQLNGGTNNQPWYYNQTGPDSNSRHYYGPYNGENQHSGQWPREQGPNSYDYQTSKPGQYHPSIHRPYYQTNRTFTKGSSSHANGTNFPHSYHGGQWGKPWNPHDNRKPADNATDQQTHPSFYGQNIGTWRWDPRKYNNTRPGNDGNSQNPNPWYPANVPSRPNVGVDRDGRSKTDPGYHQYPYVGADGNIYQSGTYEPGQIPSSSQRGHGRPGWTNGHSQGPQGEQQRPPWSQVELHPGQPGVFVPSTWTGQGRPDLNLQPCIPGQNIPCLDNKQPYTPDQGRPGPNGQRPYSPGQGGFGPELQQPFPTRPSGTGPHNWQPYPSGQGSQRPYPEGQGSPSAPPVKGGRRPPPTLPSQNAHHPGQPGRYPVESGVRSPAPNQSYPEYQPNPSVGGGYQGPKPTPMNQSVWNQVSGPSVPPSDDKFDQWATHTNVHDQRAENSDLDVKLNQWTSKTNVFGQGKGQMPAGSKTSTPDPSRITFPDSIYVNSNGIKGHYITKEIKIDQGHSQTRNYKPQNSKPNPINEAPEDSDGYDKLYPGPDRENATIPPYYSLIDLRSMPKVEETNRSRWSTTERDFNFNATGNQDPKNVDITSDPYLPSVSIEYDDNSDRRGRKDSKENTNIYFPDDIDSNVDKVDVMVDKEVWKPTLVFQNRTETTTKSSVIMSINSKKKINEDLLDVEFLPPVVEPSFSVYYVPPVQPLTHPKKPGTVTPLSGQFIRLRGGSGPRNGYVEVQGAQPGWGVVCDSRNSWSLKEAHVVCKQLGYYRGAEMSWQGRNGQWGVPSWIAADTVNCLGNETYFQSCRFTHGHECQVQRDAIGVQCLPNRIALCRKDEIPHGGQCYHLADKNSGLNHAEALNYCAQRKSQLLDVTSQEENNFISELLVQSYPEVESIMTSGVGFTTFNRIFWLWEDSSRAKFRFIKWWPGWMEDKVIPPHVGVRPVCVVMKKKFPCHDRPDSDCDTDYFFWDVEDCASSTKGHSYVCERPYDDIGCVYGKGNQYSGKANISSSGKECLYWDDDRIAHSFLMNVISRETKEKLKGHNFCRNPNPNRESKPWCFVGPHTERESCDLPSCGKLATKKSLASGSCKPKHFECLPGECIPSPWVCDGEEDCTNGADEKACVSHMSLFKKIGKHKLEGYDVEKWLNTPLKTCALRCKEADFTCRSFVHNAKRNVCLLSDSNVGLTGALIPDSEYDYFEMISRTLNCDDMFTCDNKKCINRTMVCDGKNDCNDRSDENICSVDELDYAVRLAGSNNTNEGRVEVKILGHWGQVCDDGFGMINADVICKELGFNLGALSVRLGGFYGNLDPPSRFLVDQLKCRGNETSLRECDFDGWGVHNCQPEEAVGIVCKTAVNSCQEGHWKCDDSPTCIPTPFICDEVKDCPDGSDESPAHCDAPFQLRLANGSSPMEGRVEVRHHGVWGTVCDDDFSNATATVICRSLGYGGVAIAKKNGVFGPGEGPIWLDEVFCYGNETQLYRCEHNHWGLHNCDHEEDAGVICSPGDITVSKLFGEGVPEVKEVDINDLLPSDCGKREEDFSEDDEMLARVVRGSIAPRGAYPWQASIRIRGHSRSSHWCGAVVLSPLHVLTAAHCLEGYNKGTYFVRAGDHNTEVDEGTEVEANIEDYYIHEEFRKGQRMNNDIALVLLKGRGIPLGRNVMPICLPSENAEYPDGLNCTISGWGSVETGKSAQSRDLRYGWVPLLDRSICRASYVYGEGAISDGMVCAGYLDEGVDTCDGDSGGPLACPHNGAFTLFGVTSWGQHCGSANKPGVYVKVAYYRRWIDQKIKESLSGR